MRRLNLLAAAIVAIVLASASASRAAGIFVRFKLLEPAGVKMRATLGGHRHAGDPWHFKEQSLDVPLGQWTPWVDLSKWPWHGRLGRSGGVAEWPSLTIAVRSVDPANPKPPPGSFYEVQLADGPDEKSVVVSFKERSESPTIAFLLPTPLRQHANELETGSQMAHRHLDWAKQAAGQQPISVKRFDLCTSLWGHYDPALARQELQTLGLLGFNVVNAECGLEPEDIRRAGFRIYRHTWIYGPDPQKMRNDWRDFEDRRLKQSLASPQGRWAFLDGVTHWVLSDETRAVKMSSLKPEDRDGWFRDYLRSVGVADKDLPRPIDQVQFPLAALAGKVLPKDTDLPTRRLIYHAAKFTQAWSTRQLRLATDLVHGSLPGSKTETLPTDHGFFNAWGPPCIGMAYPLLDLFEVAHQQAVDQLSAEDWLGLNHMYGPDYTWTGGQSFAYLCAIMRSAIGDRPILLRGLITPSDDGYLRLKAYSAIGQGAKSFFFWTYGPTYIGTENYWSDLRSEYDGIAKLTRAMAKAENVLADAKPVRDPVAILYSVSHDYWHTDQPAAFVEKRLLWHGLRHVGIQPDFLREEDIEHGQLKNYKALYITDWCLTRKSSAAIDQWARDGGVVHLSAAAATRDEFYEPYVPSFAQALWPDNPTATLIAEKHQYNERVDLPTIKPIAKASVAQERSRFDLPVIGCRLNLRPQPQSVITSFDDGRPAGAIRPHGRGYVMGLGFCPMLAYGQLANFQGPKLAEKWPPEPRRLIQIPLTAAQITPVIQASHDVVETSLLTGPQGSVLVLVNYTYDPIASLKLDLKLNHPVARAVSTEGKPVAIEKTPTGLRLTLPLDWTDMVLLTPE